MITLRFLTPALFLLIVFSLSKPLLGHGGTSVVATKGQPAYVSPHWPDGVGELVNDSSRTSGWNSWFSEWPNDVNQYAYEIQSTEELNRLITKLAAVKADLLQIRLTYLKEPRGLGWVTQIPEGNNIPVIFSIGDQARIDQWYKNVRKPFGVMEFTAAPVAVPPTLTVFVQNESVKLKELKIPKGISVSMGNIPTLFHRSNTKTEKERQKETSNQNVERISEKQLKELDDPSRKAVQEIEVFLESR